jgi:hypothetical protein
VGGIRSEGGGKEEGEGRRVEKGGKGREGKIQVGEF